MRLAALVLFLALGLPLVASQIVTAPHQNFNVTAPIVNGVYVAGQKLPLIYRLLSNRNTVGLQMAVTVTAAPPLDANFTTVIIADPADVSETIQFAKILDNITYWEHQYNWDIPTTTIPGSYFANFISKDTNTNASIPITIRPPGTYTDLSTGLNPSQTGASGLPTFSTNHPFGSDGGLAFSVSKTLLALGSVAVLAVVLL